MVSQFHNIHIYKAVLHKKSSNFVMFAYSNYQSSLLPSSLQWGSQLFTRHILKSASSVLQIDRYPPLINKLCCFDYWWLWLLIPECDDVYRCILGTRFFNFSATCQHCTQQKFSAAWWVCLHKKYLVWTIKVREPNIWYIILSMDHHKVK